VKAVAAALATAAVVAVLPASAASPQTAYPGMSKVELRTALLIADCMITRTWEDGSSRTADAEVATACMKNNGSYHQFLLRFAP
jgi:hypothetical protein